MILEHEIASIAARAVARVARRTYWRSPQKRVRAERPAFYDLHIAAVVDVQRVLERLIADATEREFGDLV